MPYTPADINYLTFGTAKQGGFSGGGQGYARPGTGAPAPAKKSPADQLREFGTWMDDWFTQRKGGALDEFFGTKGALENYSRMRPNAVREQLYGNPRRASASSSLYQRQLGRGGPNFVQNAASMRRPQVNRSAQLYSQGRGVGATTQNLGSHQAFATSPTTTKTRYQQRQAAGYSDPLGAMFGDRRSLERGPTALDSLYFTPEQGAQRQDAFAGILGAGGGDSGAVFKKLNSGGGALSQFLQSYRPGETRALGETYDTLKAQDTSPEEDFYNSQVKGENPAYNYLKQKFTEDSQRSANARGQFFGGRSLENERRGLAELGAEEFARRGELAHTAGEAKRARLGQRLEGASALDSLVQQQQETRGQYSGQLDKMLADLGVSRDQLQATLAKGGDEGARAMRELILQKAKDQESVLQQRRDAADRLGVSRAQGQADWERDIDQLAGVTDSTELARRRFGLDAESISDMDDRDRRQREAGIARDADRNDLDWDASDLSWAKGQTGEVMDWNKYLESLAGGSDAAELGIDNLRAGMARDVDRGDQDWAGGLVDKNQQVDHARATLRQAYDMAAAGVLTETHIGAIDVELQKAGMDEKSRKAIIRGLFSLGGAGVGAYFGGPGGAALGAKLGDTAGGIAGEA